MSSAIGTSSAASVRRLGRSAAPLGAGFCLKVYGNERPQNTFRCARCGAVLNSRNNSGHCAACAPKIPTGGTLYDLAAEVAHLTASIPKRPDAHTLSARQIGNVKHRLYNERLKRSGKSRRKKSKNRKARR